MAITKEQFVDKIEIVENGTIQVREAIRILEDGNVLSSSFHRSSFVPGSDVSDQDARVKAVAKAVWTKDVIKAYEAQIAGVA